MTKGAFFHHFASKEDLAVAAADYWSETTGALFAAAPYHEPDDPVERVFGYLDFRASLHHRRTGGVHLSGGDHDPGGVRHQPGGA